jgi:hypothetical protein
MSGSGEMAVRRFEKDEKSVNGECEDIKGEGQGLASVLDRESIVGNTCNEKSRNSLCDKTKSMFVLGFCSSVAEVSILLWYGAMLYHGRTKTSGQILV